MKKLIKTRKLQNKQTNNSQTCMRMPLSGIIVRVLFCLVASEYRSADGRCLEGPSLSSIECVQEHDPESDGESDEVKPHETQGQLSFHSLSLLTS